MTPAFTSAGVAQIGADVWHGAGQAGAGMSIGIIDVAFGGVGLAIGTELPADSEVRCYTSPGVYSADPAVCGSDGDDHGTGVAEVVADTAPQAHLLLGSPFSASDCLSVVDWMASAGVRVVNASSTSTALFEGPGDGTYPAGAPMYTCVDYAASRGMLWVNAAGNTRQGVWHGNFRPNATDARVHDFAPGVFYDQVSLTAGDTVAIALRWTDSWSQAAADYDLYLVDDFDLTIVAWSEDVQTATHQPVERIVGSSDYGGLYDIVVVHRSGPTPRLELMATTDLALRTPTRSLAAPADSRNPAEVTVGAVSTDNLTMVEPYSSIGPTLDGRLKPDLVAPDCTATITIATFCGTSEAAPYAAGVAALLAATHPSAPASDLARLLRTHVAALGQPNAVAGYGRLSMGPYIAPGIGRVDRYAGPDRFATAAAISFNTFAPGVPVAYIAYGANFPDALAGAAAAGTIQGPVLLASTNLPLNAATATELARLRPGRIVVLGGTGVLSDALVPELAKYTTGRVDRYAGPDRFATAAAISFNTFAPGVPVAYIAYGANFPDALAGAAAAGTIQGPVLLASTNLPLNAATATELARLRPGRIVVLGGTGVLSDAVLVEAGGYLAP